MLTLAGCGNSADTAGFATLSRAAAGYVAGAGARGGVLGASNLSASDAQLRAFESPLIKVTRINQGLVAGLVLADTKAPATTWRSTDGKTVTLFDGALISTKGFGNDLSSANVPGVRAGDQDVLREHYYLGGDEVMRRKQYFCDFRDAGRQKINLVGVSVDARQVIETCKGDNAFENIYWFGPGGDIVKVVQWASPEIGSLIIEVVPRDGGSAGASVATVVVAAEAVATATPAAGDVFVVTGSLD